MTARAGDALSHIDFTAPQTGFSGAVCDESCAADFAVRGAPRTAPIARNPIYSVRICMAP